MYIVAHNGIVTDGPMLHRALQRAGLSSLNVAGVIDTLPISRDIVPWHLNVQPPPEGEDDVAETAAPAIHTAVDVTPSANIFAAPSRCKAVYASQLVQAKPSTSVTATSIAEVYTPGIGGLEAELAGDGEAEVAPIDMSHSLTSIYRRLFDSDIDNSHQASADVYAMYEIFRSPLFWEVIFGGPVAVS